jgi:allantoate deiminase
MRCSEERIEYWIEGLAKHTDPTTSGFTRFSYTKEDVAAKRFLIKEMKALGLSVEMDLIGNLFGRREGEDSKRAPMMIGSHMDTVLNGGRYDGLAGVIAGMEVVRCLNAAGETTIHPLEIVAFAEEEGGRFNSAFIGSRWYAGQLEELELSSYEDTRGVTIAEAVKMLEALKDEVTIIERKTPELRAMIELHVEQGPVLEQGEHSLGIVETVTGSSAFTVKLIGKANHAGTIPMDMRQDTFYVTSLISLELNRIAREQVIHSVGTIGSVHNGPNVYNIIPGETVFTMDIRSLSKTSLDGIINHMKQYIEDIAKEHKLDCKIETNHYVTPVQMSQNIVNKLIQSASNRDHSYRLMGSGAGHDTIVVNSLCPTAMVFVPSRDGRSHCAEEYSSPKHIAKGCEIILDTVLEMDQLNLKEEDQ